MYFLYAETARIEREQEVCFCRAESSRPLIGCLDIVCWRQCSDQSEARIPVTECCVVLTGRDPGGVALCLACIHQLEAQFMRLGRNSTPEISLASSLYCIKNDVNDNIIQLLPDCRGVHTLAVW